MQAIFQHAVQTVSQNGMHLTAAQVSGLLTSETSMSKVW